MSLFLGCSKDSGTNPVPTNHAPVISQQADTSSIVGDTLRLHFSAADPDPDAVQFSLTIYCSWSEMQQGHCAHAGVDPANGNFWFSPRTYDIPARRFTVIATDVHGAVDSTTFNVSVSAALP